MTDNVLKIRIKHRIDTAANWEKCTEPPLNGELIIYKAEQGASAQFKIGDGINTVSNLPFITEGLATENYVNEQIQTSTTNMLTREEMEAYIEPYILNIDYDAILAFDTSEIVFGSNTSPILGQAILGQMVLA